MKDDVGFVLERRVLYAFFKEDVNSPRGVCTLVGQTFEVNRSSSTASSAYRGRHDDDGPFLSCYYFPGNKG